MLVLWVGQGFLGQNEGGGKYKTLFSVFASERGVNGFLFLL